MFGTPSCYGIDRNVELVPGPVDTVGLSVSTIDVAPALLQGRDGMEYEFAVGFSEAGVDGGQRRLRIPSIALPAWANESFAVASTASVVARL